jgi:hypothetical protein
MNPHGSSRAVGTTRDITPVNPWMALLPSSSSLRGDDSLIRDVSIHSSVESGKMALNSGANRNILRALFEGRFVRNEARCADEKFWPQQLK